MKKLFLYFITIIFVLSGCTKIENIKKLPPSGNKFQQYLTKFYIEFAESEAEQYDWIDSQHFATKAMQSAYGKTPLPEDPNHWKIPKTLLPSLVNARVQLLEKLTPNNIETYPENLARAQYAFDCWVEEQEENWQFDRIEECRENFYLAINSISTQEQAIKDKKELQPKKKNKLLKKDKNKKSKAKKLDEKKTTPKTLPKKNLQKNPLKKIFSNTKPQNLKVKNISKNQLDSQDFKILFKSSSKEITADGDIHLKNIAEFIKQHPKTDIILNAYSKNLTSEDDNLKLSKDRALAIKKKLTKAGASDNNITIFAFGNSEIEESAHNDMKLLELYISE